MGTMLPLVSTGPHPTPDNLFPLVQDGPQHVQDHSLILQDTLSWLQSCGPSRDIPEPGQGALTLAVGLTVPS